VKTKSARIIHRIKDRCLVQVLELWSDMTAEERQIKAKTRKVVLMLMNGAVVSTLERWGDHILEEKQLRAKALKVVQRIKNATLFNSCDVWARSIREQLALKAKLLQIGHLLKHSCLFNFVVLWSRNTMERIAVKTKSARTALDMSSISHARCEHVLGRWSEAVRRSISCRVRTQQFAQRRAATRHRDRALHAVRALERNSHTRHCILLHSQV
jgi:hypothetical protein